MNKSPRCTRKPFAPFGVVLTLAILITTQSPTARADLAARHAFSIPPQTLSAALIEFSKQADVQVVGSSDTLAKLQTEGVSGEYTGREALKLLLGISPVTFEEVTSRSVRILPKASEVSTHTGAIASPADKNTRLTETDGTGDQQATSRDSSVEKQHEQASKRKPVVLEEVVVTGTHIAGNTNPTAPIIVIDRADMEKSGYTTTQQLVSGIPQNFGGGDSGATEDGVLGTGSLKLFNNSYATGVNLRGLGTTSTLILINGHRVAPSAQGTFVDVSTIPLAAIDRVEIITDGASAIYGADAVAGVVNFILRKDYQGQETWATYGTGTDGTRRQTIVGQAVGRSWSGGNGVATLQYQDLGALHVSDRSYTSTALSPSDLLPHSTQASATANFRQDLTHGFDLSFDGLYSHAERHAYTNSVGTEQYSHPISDDGVATITLGYNPSDDWRIQASGSFSSASTRASTLYTPQIYGYCGDSACLSHDTYNTGSGELIADGKLFELPGGDLKVALGASHRRETFKDTFVQIPSQNQGYSRNVTAEFVEFDIPVFGMHNAIPGVRELDLSLAARRDEYSDFGSTTNPRYAVSWKPLEWIHLRGAYSTSFRAPNPTEEVLGSTIPTLYSVPYTAPDGSTVPVFSLAGEKGLILHPETARSYTAGVDLQLPQTPNLKLSVNYYDIVYRNRLITPSPDANALSHLDVYGSLITPIANDAAALALINTIQAEGGTYLDFAGTGPAGAGVRYLINGFEQNAAKVSTSGFDYDVNYSSEIGGNQFNAGAAATYIKEILTSFTATSTPTNLINTFGNPLHWRGRGRLGWSRGQWSTNAAINYSGSYVDTTTASHPGIGSWTTVDMQVAYKVPVAKGLTVSLSGINIFDKNPPYVVGANQFDSAIHYDVGNANPLGRVVVLAARAAW